MAETSNYYRQLLPKNYPNFFFMQQVLHAPRLLFLCVPPPPRKGRTKKAFFLAKSFVLTTIPIPMGIVRPALLNLEFSFFSS
jgi:hypothetical protein